MANPIIQAPTGNVAPTRSQLLGSPREQLELIALVRERLNTDSGVRGAQRAVRNYVLEHFSGVNVNIVKVNLGWLADLSGALAVGDKGAAKDTLNSEVEAFKQGVAEQESARHPQTQADRKRLPSEEYYAAERKRVDLLRSILSYTPPTNIHPNSEIIVTLDEIIAANAQEYSSPTSWPQQVKKALMEGDVGEAIHTLSEAYEKLTDKITILAAIIRG